MTCVDSLRICLSSDEGVCDESTNKNLIQLVYQNIINEIERIEKSDQSIQEDLKYSESKKTVWSSIIIISIINN